MHWLMKSTPQAKRLVFQALKEKILKHLSALEQEEADSVQKAFRTLTALMFKGGKGLPVGTIREWKGKKFVKIAPGKWKPKYESETRGAKRALSALKKKIAACDNARQMMRIVLENRDRFSDKNGNPLPFVQQLSDFISQTQKKLIALHIHAFEAEYQKIKAWYADARTTTTEIEGLENAIRSLDRQIKSVKK